MDAIEPKPPRRSARKVLGELLLWCALVALACPALFSSSFIALPDEYLEFHVAGLDFLAQGLREGRLDLWNPFKHGGGSLFADPSCLAPFYPFALLLPLLPLDLVLLLAWLLHLGLGSLGMRLWASARGAEIKAATGAGAAYGLSSLPVVALADGQLDIVSILAFLPWAGRSLDQLFAQLQKDVHNGRRGVYGLFHGPAGLSIAACGSFLGLLALGSHARFAAMTFAALFLYGLCRYVLSSQGARPPALLWAGGLGLSLLLGGLLAAPATVPAALEVLSQRAGPGPEAGTAVGQVLPWRGLLGLLHPRALVVDERWYHLGAVALLPLLTLSSRRQGRASLLCGLLLLLLGMGKDGPLFPVTWGIHWLIYPVETGLAALSLPFLALTVGLSMDWLCTETRRDIDPNVPLRQPSRRSTLLVLGLGGLVVLLGTLHDLRIYDPSIHLTEDLALLSGLHGLLAIAALGIILGIRGRLRAGQLGALLLALVLVDGLVYAWRVQAATENPAIRGSDFVATPSSLSGLDPGNGPQAPPTGRVLQWPLRPVRDFNSCLDQGLDPGHGWGLDPRRDPVAALKSEAAAVLGGPLRRNAGKRSGIPQVGGRAKVPPMPWTVLTSWLSEGGPLAPSEEQRLCHPEGPLDLGASKGELWIPPLLDLLSVRWIVSQYALDAIPGTRALDPGPRGGTRFERIPASQPALLLRSLIHTGSESEAIEAIFGDRIDLRTTAVLGPEAKSLNIPAEGKPPQVPEVTKYSPGRWTITLPPSGGLLRLSERYHPGWEAQDERGKPLSTLQVNLVQLGVAIPQGLRQIELRFVPPGIRLGIGLGGLGTLGLLLLFALGRRGNSEEPLKAAKNPPGTTSPEAQG